MTRKKVTISEIARHANVSIATVSRIINGKDKVKAETRQKVLSVMNELNFIPPLTTTLSDGSSKVILVCIPGFENPFNSPVIDGVQKAAYERGYEVLILQSRDYYTDSIDYQNILKQNSIAGIIIVASVPNSDLLDELSFRCPVVMCSEYVEKYGISYVSIDDVAAAKNAVKYLISTGRKKIGFINSNLNFKYSRHRLKGYLQALQEADLEINPDWTVNIASINYQMALANATHILSLPNHPDAFFTCSDVFAVSAVNAAKKLGLNVPRDVSVVGFDDIETAIMSDPPLTTVAQPCFQLGFQACELLIAKIINPQTADKQIILNTNLIVRESTTLAK